MVLPAGATGPARSPWHSLCRVPYLVPTGQGGPSPDPPDAPHSPPRPGSSRDPVAGAGVAEGRVPPPMKAHPHAHPGSSGEGGTRPTQSPVGGRCGRQGAPLCARGQRPWADVFWGDHHSSLPSTDSGSAFEGLEQSHVSLRGVIGFFLRDERHECLGQGRHPHRGRELWPPPTAWLLAVVAHRRGARQRPCVGVAAPLLSAPGAGHSSSWVSCSFGPRRAGVLKRLLLGAETTVRRAQSREFLKAKGPAPSCP